MKKKIIVVVLTLAFCMNMISGCEEQQLVDIDIDSDNNNMFSEPDRSKYEEDIEENFLKPGRIIMKNDGDIDGDQIPDFADGFNLDGITGNEDDINADQEFVPLILEIPSDIDLNQTQIQIIYNASNPVDTKFLQEEPLVYEPASGSLRIWTKKGNTARIPKQITEGGNFIVPMDYSPEQLGISDGNRTVIWYVEGIQTSQILANEVVTAKIETKGGTSKDTVRLTVVDFQFKTHGEDGELIDQEFTYNSVPSPIINVTVEECQMNDSGFVTMKISGTVLDRASGIVSDPELQLQKITISTQNQKNVIDLANSYKGESEDLWQPYKFQSNFSSTIQFPTHPDFAEYLVFLNTSKNPAGIAADLSLFVLRNNDEIYYSGKAGNDPGNYKSTMIRIDAPEETFTQAEDMIYAFNNTWPIAYQDEGDGYYFYAMDQEEKPVVFLPALYGQQGTDNGNFSNIAPITADSLMAMIKSGDLIITDTLPVEYGLMVYKDDITDQLNTITNYVKKVYMEKNKKKYIYQPRTGWAQNLDPSLETEIKYRYINHADTIWGIFKSKEQFNAHVKVRKEIVKAARDMGDEPVGKWAYKMTCSKGHTWSSIESIEEKNCPTCGLPGESSYWTDLIKVKKGEKASDAIADIFNYKALYRMGCWMGAVLVMERGMSLVNAEGLNEIVQSNPFCWGKEDGVYSTVITREGRPPTGGSLLLKDIIKWIPGDWGYIKSYNPENWWMYCTNPNCKNHKDDPLTPEIEGWSDVYNQKKLCPLCGSPGKLVGFLQGENIIYLGGPNQGTNPPIGNFEINNEEDFKKSAYFWGLAGGEQTLIEWYNTVKRWTDPYLTEIKNTRNRIKYY